MTRCVVTLPSDGGCYDEGILLCDGGHPLGDGRLVEGQPMVENDPNLPQKN